MKIVPQSEVPTTYFGRCRKCNTHVEFTKDESTNGGMEWNGMEMRKVMCPGAECGDKIIGTLMGWVK